MKSQVLHTVWCYITGEAAGEIWNWSLSGVKGLLENIIDQVLNWLWNTGLSQSECHVSSRVISNSDCSIHWDTSTKQAISTGLGTVINTVENATNIVVLATKTFLAITKLQLDSAQTSSPDRKCDKRYVPILSPVQSYHVPLQLVFSVRSSHAIPPSFQPSPSSLRWWSPCHGNSRLHSISLALAASFLGWCSLRLCWVALLV